MDSSFPFPNPASGGGDRPLSPDKDMATAGKAKMPAPAGTVEYIVGNSETLESVSAKFDATPSELVKINRLALRMVFPGQRIFIPVRTAAPVVEPERKVHSPMEGAVNKRRPSSGATLNIPGHIEPMVVADRPPVESVDAALDSEVAEVDGGRLDEDCHARFLKISAAFVIEDTEQASVTGVLLVTPNAIMFDPNVSDALVMKNGSEKYGAIIPMENILSAAIYSEIVPREVRRNSRVESIPFSSFLVHAANKYPVTLEENESPENGEEEEKSIMEDNNEEIISPVEKAEEISVPSPPAVEPVATAPPTRRVSSRSGTLSSGGEEDVAGAIVSGGGGPLLVAEKPEGVFARTRKLSPFRTKSTPLDGKSSEEDLHGAVNADGTRHRRGGSLAPLRKLSRTLMGRKDSHGQAVNEGEDWSKGMDGIFQRTGSLRATVSPKIKSFVDYSSGLFTLDNNEPESPGPKSQSESETSSPLPGESFTTWQLRRGLSREDVLQHASARRQKFGYRSVVTMEDKPELFKSIEELIPKEREDVKPSKPLYLCFRVGTPVNKSPKPVIHGPVESYGKKRLKPEYWFAIDREKAEKFYGFLLHWRPEAYGTENMDPADLGFMLFDEPDEDMNEHFAKDLRGMAKEWEVIAFDEARRRAFFLDREESVLPLPELRGGLSDILTDELCGKLLPHLPARAQGYPWTLIYSTSAHGFSLKTLYRKMQPVDSPTLFLIKDVHEHVFGAIVSCAFKVAEHFYGTGESLLFTFFPAFEVYNWNGENQYIVRGQLDNIAIGSGSGTFGIWLDEDLFKGRTQACTTFDNEPLCPCGDFEVKNVEAWCFF
ncbi:Nuclear receptor coactivator 7 [Hypsibius exemplaris]|uniref:Oxidation resistance protein 1 n=1 Tax=Hypsibius exemplaris TaxID=2072580 RepID=A0A1W0WYQ5_HYPEX|nr:Nuclear receptor coactivator 7 [Hypsibius exemplaris]